MFEPFGRPDQHVGLAYLRGPLMDGGRKAAEPRAAQLDEDGNRQALAYFITTS